MQENQVLLKDRQELTVQGVETVEGFDEGKILLKTSLGRLEIKGEGLEMAALDLEHHKVVAQGKINGLSYLEERTERIRKKGRNTVKRLLH